MNKRLWMLIYLRMGNGLSLFRTIEHWKFGHPSKSIEDLSLQSKRPSIVVFEILRDPRNFFSVGWLKITNLFVETKQIGKRFSIDFWSFTVKRLSTFVRFNHVQSVGKSAWVYCWSTEPGHIKDLFPFRELLDDISVGSMFELGETFSSKIMINFWYAFAHACLNDLRTGTPSLLSYLLEENSIFRRQISYNIN